ncbi:MAG: squalene--hopene cyclase, partial [Caulobacteraceae bacterium]|nr:squalene--hopene cyclase [Caulobacter sp.]
RGLWGSVFAALDAALHVVEPFFPRAPRRRAIDKAVRFIQERLNGDSGLGAIFPPMAYTIMMFDALGWPVDHPDVAMARHALEKLVAIDGDEAFCQPCVSPVWDTVLSAHSLMEAGVGNDRKARAGLDWLVPRQNLEVVGDWAYQRPNVRPGGWGFQYANPHYPDLDDTAVVVMAMDRARERGAGSRYDEAIARAAEWIVGMQSRDGGWAAYDADNTATFLNAIPFADHGALLDPPTSDLTARCVSMLAQLGHRPQTSEPLRRGLAFLRREQHEEGSWFGRWGVNYIYGTWSVLCAFNAAGIDAGDPAVRRAVAWLERIQNPDGGWGEDDAGYELDYKGYQPSPSTASQTAWAVIGLMAAGEIDSAAVERGVGYLVAQQRADGFWPEERFTGVGFPRVFYLRYDGYPKFFPLWALARYRNLKQGNAATVMLGM